MLSEACVGALTVEGVPHQMGSRPYAAQASKLQSPVVVAAPHPEAPPSSVDADQRHDDEIEPACADRHTSAVWYGNAEASGPRSFAQWVEANSRVTLIDDDGYVEAHSTPTRGDNQCGGVRLSVEGQIHRDAFAGGKACQVRDRAGGGSRVQPVSCCAQGAARGAQFLTKRSFHR